MKAKKSNPIWVVVEVESGVPVLAEVFQEKDLAERRQQELRSEMREDYDEVGLFQTTVTTVPR